MASMACQPARLNVSGLAANTVGVFKAGDYIQLGTGVTSRLHKVLGDVTSGAGGLATLDLWPNIRAAPLDAAVITIANTKGVFRLASNETGWSVNNLAKYGVAFSASEEV